MIAWKSAKLRLGLLAALGLFGLPVALVFLGSVVPANANAVQPSRGITIYVYSNGVHTGIVLPAVHPLHDWRQRIKPGDLADPRRAGRWLIFGWGERDFYLNTPRWSDVDPLIVLRAAVGSNRTLMHVDHLRGVWRGPDLRPIRVTATQYKALAASIDRDFAHGAAVRGYGPDDVFYPGRGRYSVARTCNEWTGSKLRAVGIRIGLWTPTAWSVMRWF